MYKYNHTKTLKKPVNESLGSKISHFIKITLIILYRDDIITDMNHRDIHFINSVLFHHNFRYTKYMSKNLSFY